MKSLGGGASLLSFSLTAGLRQAKVYKPSLLSDGFADARPELTPLHHPYHRRTELEIYSIGMFREPPAVLLLGQSVSRRCSNVCKLRVGFDWAKRHHAKSNAGWKWILLGDQAWRGTPRHIDTVPRTDQILGCFS